MVGNREELALLVGTNREILPTIKRAAHLARTVVMKVGAQGCAVAHGNEIESIEGKKVVPRDTTGAGDSFAAGYLFGLLGGRPPRQCAEIANNLAAHVVAVEGCSYESLDRETVLGA